MEVLDDTKCVAEGCERPATLQRTIEMTLPGLESGEIFKQKTQIINVPVCKLHYDLLEDMK